jgi:hypothetical protein
MKSARRLFDPADIRKLASEERWKVDAQRQFRTLDTVAAVLGCDSWDAPDIIQKALGTVDFLTFNKVWDEDDPPSEVHGLWIEDRGFYVKLRIDRAANKLMLISFHPPDDEPLITEGGPVWRVRKRR